MAQINPFDGDWYDVVSTIHRGADATPSTMKDMTCNGSPLRLDAAEKLAEIERQKSYISDVKIIKRKSYLRRN